MDALRLTPARGSRLRLVLLGDGRWAADTLRRARADGHDVAAVVERARPSDGALAAAAHECGAQVLRHPHVNAPAAVAELRALGADLLLSVAYDQILRREALAAAGLGAVNVHAGMLPRYRGRNVINWALINGEREVGVTAHFMDEGIDTGAVLVQRAVPVGWTDGYGDVLARVVAAVPGVAAEALALFAAGRPAGRPQGDAMGTYFGGRGPGDEWLDWGWSAERLHNFVRAITRPGPGARTRMSDGREVVVWRAYHDPTWPRYLATPGEVVGHRNEGVLVKAADSLLLLTEAAVDGGTPETPRWRIGTRLGRGPAIAARELPSTAGAEWTLAGATHGIRSLC